MLEQFMQRQTFYVAVNDNFGFRKKLLHMHFTRERMVLTKIQIFFFNKYYVIMAFNSHRCNHIEIIMCISNAKILNKKID